MALRCGANTGSCTDGESGINQDEDLSTSSQMGSLALTPVRHASWHPLHGCPHSALPVTLHGLCSRDVPVPGVAGTQAADATVPTALEPLHRAATHNRATDNPKPRGHHGHRVSGGHSPGQSGQAQKQLVPRLSCSLGTGTRRRLTIALAGQQGKGARQKRRLPALASLSLTCRISVVNQR